MKKITILLLVLFSLNAMATQYPLPASKRTPKVSEIFGRNKKVVNDQKSAKTQFRVSQQMYHSWNGNGYDTMALVEYQYIGSNLVKEKITKFYNGSAFLYNERELHYYDAMGRDTSIVFQHYNLVTQLWENFYKMTTKYDTYGNIVFSGIYAYQQPLGWTLGTAGMREYEYNTQGKITKITYSDWTGTAWRYTDRELWEYTGGLHTAVDNQIWESGSWTNDSRQEYVYTNNAWSQVKSFTWSGTAWLPRYWYKDITWYNFGEMKWTYLLMQEYVLGVWRNSDRAYGFYNSAGLPTRYEYQEYIGVNWVNYYRERWEYDTFNNITLEVSEEWIGAAWAISWGDKFIFEYNANNTIATEFYERWMENTKGWLKIHKLQNWYQNITAVSELPTARSSISIYPQPVREILSFDLRFAESNPKYQIIDLNGRIVKAGILTMMESGSFELHVNDLNRGVYILSVIGSQHKTQHRFIKQ